MNLRLFLFLPSFQTIMGITLVALMEVMALSTIPLEVVLALTISIGMAQMDFQVIMKILITYHQEIIHFN